MPPFLLLLAILLNFLIGIFDSKTLTSRYFEVFCIFGYILNLELLLRFCPSFIATAAVVLAYAAI